MIGTTWRSNYDGLVRTVTHISTRGKYHLLWLDEEKDCWHGGGEIEALPPDAKVNSIAGPKRGETIMLMGAMGTKREKVVDWG